MPPENEEEKMGLMVGEGFEQESDNGLNEHGGKERVHRRLGFGNQSKRFVALQLALIALYTLVFWMLSGGYWPSRSDGLVYCMLRRCLLSSCVD
jgi:hypothetical protein